MEKDATTAALLLVVKALIDSIAKQQGIDAKKLADDISASLLSLELSAERDGRDPQGAIALARALAHAALPDVPMR